MRENDHLSRLIFEGRKEAFKKANAMKSGKSKPKKGKDSKTKQTFQKKTQQLRANGTETGQIANPIFLNPDKNIVGQTTT